MICLWSFGPYQTVLSGVAAVVVVVVAVVTAFYHWPHVRALDFGRPPFGSSGFKDCFSAGYLRSALPLTAKTMFCV